ncbi:MAG TPA: hypothetical protein VKB87_17140, partial [Myxococcaceae bacterium]|nr:hypothetical protein [Myxococcaceae bacterium]
MSIALDIIGLFVQFVFGFVVSVTPEHWKRVAELFEAAVEHEPAARADFLARATAGDAALAEEVLRLLASDENAGTFLNHPAGVNSYESSESSSKTALDPFIGRILSHYRVEARLGSGG